MREVVRRETTHPFSVYVSNQVLKQGATIDDFMKPDRVVVGAEDPRAAELMKGSTGSLRAPARRS